MIYTTLRTNSTLKNEILESWENGEHIRAWQESTPWTRSEFPLYRIYAEVKKGSKADMAMQRSSSYETIDRDVFYQAVDRTSALELFNKMSFVKKNPRRPFLLILAGYPLSGKTLLAREIMHRSKENMLHVESDRVREFISKSMGNESLKYNYIESHRTFNTCWELIRLGLSYPTNVIFDATNLQERGRIDAYRVAMEYRAHAVVVLVDASDAEIDKRLRSVAADRQRAYNHMSKTNFTKVRGDTPFLRVESSKDTTLMLTEIASKLPREYSEISGLLLDTD